MSVRSGARCAAVSVVLLTTIPAGAAAAPGSLGSGANPSIAMDAAGTAYVAWRGIGDPTTLHFCRLPRNAVACANPATQVTPTPGASSLIAPFVTVDGSTVHLLVYRSGGELSSGGVYLYVSTNGGNSFDPPAKVGDLAFHNAAVGPGAGISLVTDVSATPQFQHVPTSGSPASPPQITLPNGTYGVQGAVGMADASTPVVTYTDLGGAGKVWRCEGCTPGVKDPNDPANWAGGTDIGNADDAHMASGPAGLFLKTSDSLTGGSLIVRKYGAGTFGAPATIPNATGEHPQSHMTQDPAGRLHVLWPRIDADAIRLYYATSDDGAGWAQGALHAAQENIQHVRVAAAPDHVGLAVWQTGGAGSEIRFLPMGPTPPVPPPPVQNPPPPAPQTPSFPATYAGSLLPVTVTDRRASFTLSVPRNCVFPGQRFRVTLKWKRKKRKGNLFVKVRRSDFYLGTRRVKIDRKVPFVHTYQVRVTQPPGSTITLRARAFIKMRRGKSPTKSVRARVKVCG